MIVLVLRQNYAKWIPQTGVLASLTQSEGLWQGTAGRSAVLFEYGDSLGSDILVLAKWGAGNRNSVWLEPSS